MLMLACLQTSKLLLRALISSVIHTSLMWCLQAAAFMVEEPAANQQENVIFQKYGLRKKCPRNGDKQLTAIVYWKAVLGSNFNCYMLLNTEYMVCNLLHLLRKESLNDNLYMKSWWIQRDYIWHVYNIRKKPIYRIQHPFCCFASFPDSDSQRKVLVLRQIVLKQAVSTSGQTPFIGL